MYDTVWPIALLLALSVPGAAPAAECAGVALPDVVTESEPPLRLNGSGVREIPFFGIDVYVGALYLEQPARSARDVLGPLPASRLLLHFLREVGRTRLTDGFARAFARSEADGAPLRERLDRLNGWMRDMEPGEELVFDYRPDSGTAVVVAGAPRGVVAGADFARAVLGNWLGAHAVDAGLETGLLGGPCG